MKSLFALRRALTAAGLVLISLLAAPSAFATHLRGGSLSWQVTSTDPTAGTYTVQFTLTESQRWSFPANPGTCTGPITGSTQQCVPVGTAVTLQGLIGINDITFVYGDGVTTKGSDIKGTVTSVNQAQDYATAIFVFTHTYNTSSGAITAIMEANARLSTLKLGPDEQEYISTIVQNYANPSPVVSVPAILSVPLENATTFNVASAVSDIDPNVTLVYRLATPTEMFGVGSIPCPNNNAVTYTQAGVDSGNPPGFTVSSTGLVTWDETQISTAVTGGNCKFGTPTAGDLWPAQIMVEAHNKTTNALITKVPVDLLLEFVIPVGDLPTVTINPFGTQTVNIGSKVSFTATGSSANSGATVTLYASGVPAGATVTGLNATVKPPASSTFTWTPTGLQAGSYVVTYTVTDENLQQAQASERIVVATLPTISCSNAITTAYQTVATVSASVYDPSDELLNVVWTVDGVTVRTDTGLTAYPSTYTDALDQTFGNVGPHTVTVTATDPHGVSVSCSPSVTVVPADQRIVFNPLATFEFGNAPFAVSASATSGLPVSFAALGNCSLSGSNQINILGAGSCQITASQAGNTNYNAAPNVVQSATILQAPSVTTVFCTPGVTYNGLPQTPCTANVTGAGGLNQSLPVTYQQNVNAGQAQGAASYPGDANHIASSGSSGFVIVSAPQTITLTAPPSPAVAGSSVVLSATGGGSGNPVVFSVQSGPAVLGDDGVTLTYIGAGTVVVAADQAASADGNYAAAQEATATISVSPASSAYTAGTVPVAQQSSIQTATLNFPNGGTLGSLSYLTQGAANLDFIGCTNVGTKMPANPKGGTSLPTSFGCGPKTKAQPVIPVCSVGTTYAAGQICTVSYIFQPNYPGQRLGAISAVDSNGNVMGTSYVSGLGTGPQVVFPGNTTTTALGGGLTAPTGVAVDGAGNVYVGSFNPNSSPSVIPPNCMSATCVTTVNTGLGYQVGLAVDGSGALYVSDSSSVHEVPQGCTSSGCVLTLGGGFSYLTSLAVDGAGNVYAGDGSTNHPGLYGIPAGCTSSSCLTNPGGVVARIFAVASDPAGNVYASTGTTVLQVPANCFATNCVTTLNIAFKSVSGLVVDANGNLYISDSGAHTVAEVPVGCASSTCFITLASGIHSPQGIAVDGSGNVYFSNNSAVTANNGLFEIPLSTPPSVTFADTNVGSASTSNPQNVTVANNGYDPTSSNPLTFSGVATGTTSFVLDAANACSTSTSLEPGQTCSLAVDFTPQTSGSPLTDAVTLTDNNLNNILSTSSPQLVPLSGNGLQQAPTVTVAPATITYGTATVSLSATIAFAGTTAPTGAVTFTIDSGSAVPATCTGTTSPLSCTASYASNTLGVPTHGITASIAASPGFLTASGTNTLTVTRVGLGVTIIGNPTKVYDGTANATLTPANYQITGLMGTDQIAISQTVGTYLSQNAGPEPVTAEFFDGLFSATSGSLSNYFLPSFATGSGTITPAGLGITIIGNPTKVYDGTISATLTPANYQINGLVGNDQIAISQTVGTYLSRNAGPEPVTAQLFNNQFTAPSGSLSNYILPSHANGSGTITAASLTVTAGSYSGAYDGNTHALSACTVSTNFDSLTCTNNPAGPVGPDVGGAIVQPTVIGSTANYNVNTINGAWSITQAGSVTSITCPASVVYTGTAQTPCTASVTGVGSLSQAVSVTYTLNTNVGQATATATFTGDANHTGSTKSTTFNITPATLTLTAGSYSGVYDGNTHPLSACVASSNPDGLTCTNNPVGPVGPDVGGTTVTPVASGSTSNYNVTAVNGAWSISPLAVQLNAGSYRGVYDGNTHAPAPCTTTYVGVSCTNSPALGRARGRHHRHLPITLHPDQRHPRPITRFRRGPQGQSVILPEDGIRHSQRSEQGLRHG